MADAQTSADANATLTGENAEHSDGISSIPADYKSAPVVDRIGTTMPTVDLPPAAKTKDDADTAASGDETTAGKDDTAAQDAQKGDDDGESDTGTKTGTKGQEGRFDQDPDWQRMKTERDEAKAQAETIKAVLDTLTKGGQAPGQDAAGKQDAAEAGELPFKDITKMSKEDLIEWFENDPIGYEKNRFAQFFYETKQVLAHEQAQERQTESVQGTYEAFKQDHPGFQVALDSGEITKFMEAHPGHNHLSAYLSMTTPKLHDDAKSYMDAVVKEAREQAVKETEERVNKNWIAKRGAALLNAGPTVKSGGEGSKIPDELKDTKAHGGRTAALASILHKMRASP